MTAAQSSPTCVACASAPATCAVACGTSCATCPSRTSSCSGLRTCSRTSTTSPPSCTRNLYRRNACSTRCGGPPSSASSASLCACRPSCSTDSCSRRLQRRSQHVRTCSARSTCASGMAPPWRPRSLQREYLKLRLSFAGCQRVSDSSSRSLVSAVPVMGTDSPSRTSSSMGGLTGSSGCGRSWRRTRRNVDRRRNGALSEADTRKRDASTSAMWIG